MMMMIRWWWWLLWWCCECNPDLNLETVSSQLDRRQPACSLHPRHRSICLHSIRRLSYRWLNDWLIVLMNLASSHLSTILNLCIFDWLIVGDYFQYTRDLGLDCGYEVSWGLRLSSWTSVVSSRLVWRLSRYRSSNQTSPSRNWELPKQCCVCFALTQRSLIQTQQQWIPPLRAPPHHLLLHRHRHHQHRHLRPCCGVGLSTSMKTLTPSWTKRSYSCANPSLKPCLLPPPLLWRSSWWRCLAAWSDSMKSYGTSSGARPSAHGCTLKHSSSTLHRRSRRATVLPIATVVRTRRSHLQQQQQQLFVSSRCQWTWTSTAYVLRTRRVQPTSSASCIKTSM